jgi:hypothetical protein
MVLDQARASNLIAKPEHRCRELVSCNHQATMEGIGYHEGDALVTPRTAQAVTSLGHSDPALGFHLEAREGTRWKEYHRDTQVQGGLKRLLEPLRQ